MGLKSHCDQCTVGLATCRQIRLIYQSFTIDNPRPKKEKKKSDIRTRNNTGRGYTGILTDNDYLTHHEPIANPYTDVAILVLGVSGLVVGVVGVWIGLGVCFMCRFTIHFCGCENPISN